MILNLTAQNKPKISIYEYTMTKLIVDSLNIDYEHNCEISYNYVKLFCGERNLHFPERYELFELIPKGLLLFRPFKNDRHANILVDTFDEEMNLTDSMTIMEDIDKNGKKMYSGYFTNQGIKIDKSYTYKCPSIAFLKSYMVAKMSLDEYDYSEFSRNLKLLLSRGKSNV